MSNEQTYEPSPDLRASLRRWVALVAAEKKAREELRSTAAAEMKLHRVSNSELAEHLPFTQEWVRGVAVEYHVPGGRRRALRGIKQKLEEST